MPKKARKLTFYFSKSSGESERDNRPSTSADTDVSVENSRESLPFDSSHVDERISESGNVNSDSSSDSATESADLVCESDKSKDASRKRKKEYKHKFQTKWLTKYNWLQYDDKSGVMSCKLCKDKGYQNTLTEECKNYRSSTLSRHVKTNDHQKALRDEVYKLDFKKASENAISQKDSSVISAMRCAYWLCKEGVATMKYASLVSLMKIQGCEDMKHLAAGENATYESRETANEFMETFAEVIQNEIDKKLNESVYNAILIDESTDINVNKKLVIYGRVVMENLDQETLFLGNVHLTDSRATALTIFTSLKEFWRLRGIDVQKILAFGSDGASVMTGKKGGVAALLREESPHCINIHCVAHRLNLCTSKAADDVTYISKVFQKTLTDLFYYFKKSACRVAELKHIQQILDDPQIKMKEVHEIRWFAMYDALNTVYRTWRSLVKYFKQIKKPTSKEEELLTNLTDYKFVYTLHVMMDVIPKFSELSLVFQKVDLDISCVRPAVDGCLDNLKMALTGKSYYQLLLKDQVKINTETKVVKYWGEKLHDKDVKEAETMRNKFLNSLQDRVKKRFPSECISVATSFAVLGMRSISFMSKEQLASYGKKEMDTLTDHYGSELSGPSTTSKALIDKASTMCEWDLVKQVVLSEMYPRDRFRTLWKLIYLNHKDMFPNLLTLARLALALPLQTADCERGFSCQNDLHTPSRNRLSADTLNKLMIIKLEGADITNFNFSQAVTQWKRKKRRKYRN